MSKQLIEYELIEADVLRRIADRIVVAYQSVDAEFACRASLALSDDADIQGGYPRALECFAQTPQRAVRGVIDMLRTWFIDPRSPTLVPDKTWEVRNAPGHEPRTAEEQSSFMFQ
jgi:hypothetical protein